MLFVPDEIISEELVQGFLLLADRGDIEPEVEAREGRKGPGPARKNAEPDGDQDIAHVKRVADIGIRPGCGEFFVFFHVPPGPEPDNDPGYGEKGPGHEQTRPGRPADHGQDDQEKDPHDLPNVRRAFDLSKNI